MEKNRRRWPTAAFSRISDPARLPFDDQLFDAVFSVFVIEHTVYPMHFLNECVRVLRLGGVFLLRCPNFLAEGKLTSQRAGSSMGTGREKLRHGALIDALLTFWDRKIRIPRRCADVRRKIGAGWGFYVNLAPVCFVDPFAPDHDAVYLTYSREMIGYLQDRVLFSHPATELADRGSIYLTGKRFGVTA
jgi:SAM-dependent methyltransferase